MPKGYRGVKAPMQDGPAALTPSKDKNLYVIYKYGTPSDVPITNIAIIKTEYNEACPLSILYIFISIGYHLIDVDIGQDSYLCYTKAPGCPITDIKIISAYFFEECPYGYEEVSYSISGYKLLQRELDSSFCIKRVYILSIYYI